MALQDQLKEVARTAAKKVSDILPLVDYDREWLDQQSVESFFRLANLGLNDDLQSADMHQVARVCVQVARTAGPSPFLAPFVNQVAYRLKHRDLGGLELVDKLEQVYQTFKDAKPTLQRLLRLADSEVFDDVISTICHYSPYLALPLLTSFVDAMMDFYEQTPKRLDEWRQAVSALPIQLAPTAQEIAQVLEAAIARGFDDASLNLVQLLHTYQDSAPLLAFVARTAHLLNKPETAASLAPLLHCVSQHVKEDQSLDRVFQGLRLLKASSDPSEIALVTQLLETLLPTHLLHAAAALLADTFRGLDEESVTSLGIGMIRWLYSGGKPRAEAEFAMRLLPLLRTNAHASLAGRLFAEMAAPGMTQAVERTVLDLTQRLSLESALELSVHVAASALRCNDQVFSILSALLLSQPQPAPSLIPLLHCVSQHVKEATDQSLDRMFQGLRLLKASSDPSEIALVTQLLETLLPTHLLHAAATLLVDTFRGLDEESVIPLGMGMIRWLYTGGKPRAEAEFAMRLLPLIRTNAHASLAGRLFAEMAAPGMTQAVERAVLDLTQRLSLESALELSVHLAASALRWGDQLSSILTAVINLMDATTPSNVATTLLAMLQRGHAETASHCLLCAAAFHRRHGNLRLVLDMMAALEPADDPTLVQFAKDLTSALHPDDAAFDLILRIANWWQLARARLPGDARIVAFCLHALKLKQARVMTEMTLAFETDGASYGAALTLAEVYMRRSLSEEQLSGWLHALNQLRNANSFEELFRRVDDAQPQAVTAFISTVLHLARDKSAEDLSRTLTLALDLAEVWPLLANLAALADVDMKATLLDTVRLQPTVPVTKACSELSGLLAALERDQVQLPDCRPVLARNPEELIQWFQACVPLVHNPAHRLTSLTAKLLSGMQQVPEFQVLLFIPTAAADVLPEVTPDRVQFFGELLLGACPAKTEHVRKLQGGWPSLRAKIVQHLNSGTLTVDSLELLLLSSLLVDVTASNIRFFNLQSRTWNPPVGLSSAIQADDSSRWVILEDRRIFCCGGDV